MGKRRLNERGSLALASSYQRSIGVSCARRILANSGYARGPRRTSSPSMDAWGSSRFPEGSNWDTSFLTCSACGSRRTSRKYPPTAIASRAAPSRKSHGLRRAFGLVAACNMNNPTCPVRATIRGRKSASLRSGEPQREPRFLAAGIVRMQNAALGRLVEGRTDRAPSGAGLIFLAFRQQREEFLLQSLEAGL